MNNRNLQRELEEIIKGAKREGRRPRLLLHVCCAPCSSYCMEYLHEHFDMTVFFYNPNIDNPAEYKKRVEEGHRLVGEMEGLESVEFWEGKYDPSRFHELVKGLEEAEEGQERCHICYEMRLREAAQKAAREGFEYFTTSLTISPMKDALKLCLIGEKAGAEFGVKYLPSDFKKKNGYKRSVELSEKHGLYRQNYCGCSFSRRSMKKR